jgi:hypothetical protein
MKKESKPMRELPAPSLSEKRVIVFPLSNVKAMMLINVKRYNLFLA